MATICTQPRKEGDGAKCDIYPSLSEDYCLSSLLLAGVEEDEKAASSRMVLALRKLTSATCLEVNVNEFPYVHPDGVPVND